jgi:hypothetical protein
MRNQETTQERVSMKFNSLDELKNFVISEKIANYEKQKEVSEKLFATLKKGNN